MSSILRLPALRAFVVQIAALAVVLCLAAVAREAFDVDLGLAAGSVLQGVTAAAIAWRSRAEPWWLAIHLVFVPLLMVVLAADIPSWVFLLAFCAMLALYGQIFRTRVPYFPSTPAVRAAVGAVLPPGPVRFIDIGSGFGGLPIRLARERPDGRFEGIELALFPFLGSYLRACLTGSRARLRHGDYTRLDLHAYDVVFAYLSPAAMPGLWAKATAEMAPGSLLLSFEFGIPGSPPDLVLQPAPGQPPLYGWRF
ncbi:MAG TPA: class I SAM-dependent methyltransferase [Noviherbaspirillum sp.]|nr:class I SAM-dependent methyltransferase [Noviherbaspirillum sp.]